MTDFKPPEPFKYKVIRCPACYHGIDPHGIDPGGECAIGGCECMWQPNDIAAVLIGQYNLDAVLT